MLMEKLNGKPDGFTTVSPQHIRESLPYLCPAHRDYDDYYGGHEIATIIRLPHGSQRMMKILHY